jgi:hypothetical protein
MNADEKRKVQDTLLRSADAVIREMRAQADGGQLDNLSRCADKIQELTRIKEFPNQRAQEVQRSVKFILRDAYARRVGDLMAELNRRLHNGDEDARKDLLGKVRQHISLAVQFGADEEFRSSVDRHLQVIELTTDGGIDKQAKAEAMRRTELRDTASRAPGGKERRRAIRYADPVLTIELDGEKYTTLNWSTRGLLLDNFTLPLRLGTDVRITLSCEEVPGGGRTWARVIRRVRERHELALEFPDISTVVLGLMHEMKLAGIRPDPC